MSKPTNQELIDHVESIVAKCEELTRERDEARHGEAVATATLYGMVEERTALTAERDEARLQTGRILNEIDCRIEHGADSNGHLEAIRNLFTPADIEAHEVRGDVAGPEGAD